MLMSMGSELFMEWLAYMQIEPMSRERGDARIGLQTAALLNAKLKPGAQSLQPSDFIPKFGAEPEARNPTDRLIEKIVAFNRELGGKDERRHKHGASSRNDSR